MLMCCPTPSCNRCRHGCGRWAQESAGCPRWRGPINENTRMRSSFSESDLVILQRTWQTFGLVWGRPHTRPKVCQVLCKITKSDSLKELRILVFSLMGPRQRGHPADSCAHLPHPCRHLLQDGVGQHISIGIHIVLYLALATS